MKCCLNRRGYASASIVIGVVMVFLAQWLVQSHTRAHDAPDDIRGGDAISGFVRDRHGPVAGAVVRVQTTTRIATTEVDGRFMLSVAGMGGGPFNITAWAKGYFTTGPIQARAGQNDLKFRLKAHATEDNPDYQWSPALCPPAQSEDRLCCAECHSRIGADLYPFLPVDEWLLDAHSQSAVNPRFLSMYTGRAAHGPSYRSDFPDSAGNCAACHVPAAAVASPHDVDPTKISGVAAEGVTCDFCHKVWDVRLNPATGLPFDNMPGVLSYEFRRPMEGNQFFAGPFDDVAPGVDTFSPLQKQSRFCAPCHYGSFFGTVIYNSFGEWLDSPYSDPASAMYKTCQDCHMPTGLTCCFALPAKGGRLRDPATIASHRMPGASDEEHLRNAASLQVTASTNQGHVNVEVRVKNEEAGHHLPTGSPLRHVMVVVAAKDATGRSLLLDKGPRLPYWTGDFSGLPGRAYAKVLEELNTRISPTAAFWKPTRILSDTRLAALEVDLSHYTFVATGRVPLSVEARLIFRRAFQDLAELKGWENRDIVMATKTVRVQGFTVDRNERFVR